MNEAQKLLKSIACCLAGIDYRELTHSEKKIADLLIDKKWLHKGDNGVLALNIALRPRS